MKLEYCGKTSCYNHKHGEWENSKFSGPDAVSKVFLIEAQLSNMPIEVYEDVRHLWRYLEYGDDGFYYPFTLEGFSEMFGENGTILIEKWYWGPTKEEQKGWVKEESNLPYLTQWLNDQGFEPNQKLLLHYWW